MMVLSLFLSHFNSILFIKPSLTITISSKYIHANTYILFIYLLERPYITLPTLWMPNLPSHTLEQTLMCGSVCSCYKSHCWRSRGEGEEGCCCSDSWVFCLQTTAALPQRHRKENSSPSSSSSSILHLLLCHSSESAHLTSRSYRWLAAVLRASGVEGGIKAGDVKVNIGDRLKHKDRVFVLVSFRNNLSGRWKAVVPGGKETFVL